MPSFPGWTTGNRRRRAIILTLGGLVVVAATMAVLAIPLLGVPGSAQAAKTDLTAAKVALQAGDVASARTSVASARDHIDSAQEDPQGIGADAWSSIPLLGTPVTDARHLVQALDDVTAVAKIAVELYPSVAGDEGHAVPRRARPTKDRWTGSSPARREAGSHLTSADSELAQVRARRRSSVTPSQPAATRPPTR